MGPNHRKFITRPVARPAAVVSGANFRFTVLTDGLLRYEWSFDGQFEDRASVFAVHRDLPVPQFRVNETDRSIEIITSRFHLDYDREAFSPSGLSAVIKGSFREHASVWRYGNDTENLGGSARTLDGVDGRIALGPGVISRSGFAIIDDSESMLFDHDGYIASRRPGERIDGYLFAYGHDYFDAVKALYAISGSQPLLPRWALGNWWSRYHAYSADEYLALMDEFRDQSIPLAVAVLDMDWHLVDDQRVIDAGSTGWTGYTWNRKLFPEPANFLAELHSRKLKTTLNDHPADGIHCYEDAYEVMARAVNHDTINKDPVKFDMIDRRFLNAFYDILHRGLENDGVDFWWIDWQQGTRSRLRGIDPLWLLNHFTFLDSGRENRRALTFSRYAGPGSHRYPVGFSGDTIVTWASLHFQPEFTATASNIGYGWWSHDIGGHMFGSKDDELASRWVQLGVWSPILRLHSTNSRWNSKEPWNFGKEAQSVMTESLRYRHRLLPYIYTMNVRASLEGIPLVQPMYWSFPTSNEAYRAYNQFHFGSELMVIPITAPQNPELRLARVRGWLPPGRYIDIFNGAVYDGDRELFINRPLGGYPVFARQGSIIPLDGALQPGNGCENPHSIEILLVVGADGKFEMLEDNDIGSSFDDIQGVRIPIKFIQSTGTIHIGPIQPGSGTNRTRVFGLRLLGMAKLRYLRVFMNDKEQNVFCKEVSNGSLVQLGSIGEGTVRVEIGENPQLEFPDPASQILPFLSNAQLNFELKDNIWQIVTAKAPKMVQISRLHALEMEPSLLDAVLEYMLADSGTEN